MKPIDIYEAKDYEYFDLKCVTSDAYNFHLKLYEGYIKKLNEINSELKTVNKDAANHNYSHMRELLIEKTHNFNSIILHEHYFENLTGKINEPTVEFRTEIEETFGTWDDYLLDVTASAKSARAGWAVTTYNRRDQSIQNFAVDLHDFHVPITCELLLVVDVWEHAYTKDYGIDKASYIKETLKEIDWEVVSKRYSRVLK